MKKPTFFELLFVAFLFGVVVFLAIDAFFYSGTAPDEIKNAGPCVPDKNDVLIPVASFDAKESQFICAELITMDVSKVKLQLKIKKIGNDTNSVIYTNNGMFDEGHVFFPITPALSPGRYTAVIISLRPILAEFEFDVVK